MHGQKDREEIRLEEGQLMDLKPCANCGGKAQPWQQYGGGAKIFCPTCKMQTGLSPSLELAAEVWNRRAGEVAPELRKAVRLLHKVYEKAKQAHHVRDPLAYSLYRVWKAMDRRADNG